MLTRKISWGRFILELVFALAIMLCITLAASIWHQPVSVLFSILAIYVALNLSDNLVALLLPQTNEID